MAQGGRGWFHRKRHQPDPEQPTGTTHASSLAAQQAQPNPSTPPAVGPSASAADNTQWSPEARSSPQPPQLSAASPTSSPVGESSSLGPAPAGASPAGAQGRPGGGAEADSDGIAGAAASQSTASQWTRDSDSPARGTEASAAHPEASTSPAPGLAAPAGVETRTATPMSSDMEHLESNGDQSSPAQPAQEGTTPSASPVQEHTPVHVGVGAPTPPPTTTWPMPSSTDPAASSSTTGSYDWDAATAAALSDEPATPDTATPPHHHTPTTADRLLEDIIREIVGDAAAETVSSLQPERPASIRPERAAATSGTPRRWIQLPRRWMQLPAVDAGVRTAQGDESAGGTEPEPASTPLEPPPSTSASITSEPTVGRTEPSTTSGSPVAVDPRDAHASGTALAPEDSPPTSRGAETHAAEEERFPTLPKRPRLPATPRASRRHRSRHPRPPPGLNDMDPHQRPVALTSAFQRTAARMTTPSCRVSSPVPRR